MFRASLIIAILFTAGLASAQEYSASVDPFRSKPINEKSISNGQKKSFFPKIPTPKIPNLNPFSSKNNKPKNLSSSKKKSNMFQQFSTGTKQFFSKTTQTLMPWTKPKNSRNSNQIVPAFMQRPSTAKKKKGNGIDLMSFLSPEPKDQPSRSPSDFIGKKRPTMNK